MKKLTLLIFALFLLLPTLAFAAPPDSTFVIYVDEGYIIDYPMFSSFVPNTDYTLNFHVTNKSDGMPITSARCYLDLYDNTYKEIFAGSVSPTEYDYKFNVTFNDTGAYSGIIRCNTSAYGGTTSFSINVLKSYYQISTESALLLLAQLVTMALLFIGGALCFAYLYSKVEEQKKVLRLLFLGGTILMLLIPFAIDMGATEQFVGLYGEEFVSNVASGIKVVSLIFKLTLAALLLYIIWSVTTAVINRKKENEGGDR